MLALSEPVDPTERRAQTWRRALVGIILVAALARLTVIVATPHFVPWGDPADYERNAISIATGHGFAPTQIATPGTPSAFRPPAYPYLLGGVYAVVGIHPLAGRLLGVLLGVLTVILLAYLGRAVWSQKVGLVAAGMGAVFPPMVMLNATLLSESLFLPLSLLLALCVLAYRRAPSQLRWALLTGAVCGLAALTRVVADLWLIPGLIVVILASAGRRRWIGAAAVVLGFVITVAPWTIRNAETFHALVPISTEGGYTMAGQYNAVVDQRNAAQAVWRDPLQLPGIASKLAPLYERRGGIDEAQLDRVLRDGALTYLVHHPRHVVAATLLDTLRMLDLGLGHDFVTATSYHELNVPDAMREPTTLSAQLVAILALLALLARAAGRLPFTLGPRWLWTLPVLAIAVTVPFGGNPRKLLPADPFLLLLASLTVCTMIDACLSRRRVGDTDGVGVEAVAGLARRPG